MISESQFVVLVLRSAVWLGNAGPDGAICVNPGALRETEVLTPVPRDPSQDSTPAPGEIADMDGIEAITYLLKS